MNKTITIDGKPVNIQLSQAAKQALQQRTTQLVAEMELLFSCLIAKQVNFREFDSAAAGVPVTDNLAISFRAIMTQSCDISGTSTFETETFPVANSERYVPYWLEIDYQSGQWQGEFGYSR